MTKEFYLLAERKKLERLYSYFWCKTWNQNVSFN